MIGCVYRAPQKSYIWPFLVEKLPHVSHGSGATRLRHGGIFNGGLMTTSRLSLIVKDLWKSISIWRRYGQECIDHVFTRYNRLCKPLDNRLSNRTENVCPHAATGCPTVVQQFVPSREQSSTSHSGHANFPGVLGATLYIFVSEMVRRRRVCKATSLHCTSAVARGVTAGRDYIYLLTSYSHREWQTIQSLNEQ